MRKLFMISLCFSQFIMAQHKKKTVEPVPLKQQIEKYKIPEDQLLNGALKGSKWYFNTENYKEGKLSFDKDNTKPDVLNFVDNNKFQININQKNCKSLIKGTYEIKKMNDGSTTVQLGHHPFNITSPSQKCAANLIEFLSGAVDIYVDENMQTMEMSEGENFPPTVPGS